LFVGSTVVQAQNNTDGVDNLYAGGLSYSINGGTAGTGLYARNLHLSNDGTYGFTVIDAVPSSIKPFLVTSNVGIGIAQALTVAGHKVYVPTSAGVSWTGTNVGFQWNGGALIPVKSYKGIDIFVDARFLKSNVSAGSGYQPIVGFLVGWGS
jgi:hypothetical protein